MISNCYFWARWCYCVRVWRWYRSGCPEELVPYWVERPSRSRPRWMPHFMLGTFDGEIDALRLTSFKPDRPSDDPWWLAWRHLFFVGRVQLGDARAAASDPSPEGPIMPLHYADILKALTAVHQIAQAVQTIAPAAPGVAKLDAAVQLAAAVAPTLQDTLGGLDALKGAFSAVVALSKGPGGAMAPAVQAPSAVPA